MIPYPNFIEVHIQVFFQTVLVFYYGTYAFKKLLNKSWMFERRGKVTPHLNADSPKKFSVPVLKVAKATFRNMNRSVLEILKKYNFSILVFFDLNIKIGIE